MKKLVTALPPRDLDQPNLSENQALFLTELEYPLTEELKVKFMTNFYSSVEENGAGFDFNSYKTAPLGIRIWGGSTVENENISNLLPWLDWSYEYNKNLFSNEV